MAESIMLALGRDYRFSVETAAYQTLERSTEYRWTQQERIGRRPASQFVGIGTDTITLEGYILPTYKGGLGQLGRMRDIAGRGEPQLLSDAQGKVHGRWCITQIDEGHSIFMTGMVPRKITFTITLQHYGEDF